MRESLHVCGKILTTDDYHFFALCCEKCEASFGQWSGFLKHLSSKHDLNLPVKNEYEKEEDHNSECEEVSFKATVKKEMEYELIKQNKVDAAEYESESEVSDDDREFARACDSNDEGPGNDDASAKSEESTADWDMDDDKNNMVCR